jgi:hypothetical protein
VGERGWLQGVAGGMSAALLVGSLVALYVRQPPKPVSVDDAVAQFRKTALVEPAGEGGSGAGPATSQQAGADASGAGAPGGSGRGGGSASGSATAGPGAAQGPAQATVVKPSPGVYVYDTEGYETVEAATSGRHDYPDQTTIVVRHAGCGWTVRWQPLQERWDETNLCAEPSATSAVDFRTYHEFFKKSQEQYFTCPPGSHVSRFGQPQGATWSWGCSSGGNGFEATSTYVGMEPVTVGGTTVQAARFRFDAVMTGANRGKQTQERWVDPATGLELRMTNDIDAEADSPFGTVKYREVYRLDLTSLRPRT